MALNERARLSRLKELLNNENDDDFVCSCVNDVTEVVRVLRNQPNHSSSLKFRRIDCFSICRNGIVAIVDALSNFCNTTVTTLTIFGLEFNVTTSTVVAVGRMLNINKSLTKLSITCSVIHPDGAIVIGDAL